MKLLPTSYKHHPSCHRNQQHLVIRDWSILLNKDKNECMKSHYFRNVTSISLDDVKCSWLLLIRISASNTLKVFLIIFGLCLYKYILMLHSQHLTELTYVRDCIAFTCVPKENVKLCCSLTKWGGGYPFYFQIY